jgi:cell wall-associated NlpC family hydrolase
LLPITGATEPRTTMTKAKSLSVIAVLLLAACASAPPSPRAHVGPASDAVASRAADNALEMVGKPYRYSGSTPAGFDCSGLVQYSYSKAGLDLPRETQTQRYLGQPVSRSRMRRGDLLFFDQEGQKSSHVALYLGDGRFVHAPSTGGRVRTDRLDAAYWRKHFVEARRI